MEWNGMEWNARTEVWRNGMEWNARTEAEAEVWRKRKLKCGGSGSGRVAECANGSGS